MGEWAARVSLSYHLYSDVSHIDFWKMSQTFLVLTSDYIHTDRRNYKQDTLVVSTERQQEP